MSTGGSGWQKNIEHRSLNQSSWGSGLVAMVSAGSSAPYFLAIEARTVMALMPASLLIVHLPSLSNQAPPAPIRMGLNWITVHPAACLANFKPGRGNLSPALMVNRFA